MSLGHWNFLVNGLGMFFDPSSWRDKNIHVVLGTEIENITRIQQMSDVEAETTVESSRSITVPPLSEFFGKTTILSGRIVYGKSLLTALKVGRRVFGYRYGVGPRLFRISVIHYIATRLSSLFNARFQEKTILK